MVQYFSQVQSDSNLPHCMHNVGSGMWASQQTVPERNSGIKAGVRRGRRFGNRIFLRGCWCAGILLCLGILCWGSLLAVSAAGFLV
jgi:hypothetical protein